MLNRMVLSGSLARFLQPLLVSPQLSAPSCATVRPPGQGFLRDPACLAPEVRGNPGLVELLLNQFIEALIPSLSDCLLRADLTTVDQVSHIVQGYACR